MSLQVAPWHVLDVLTTNHQFLCAKLMCLVSCPQAHTGCANHQLPMCVHQIKVFFVLDAQSISILVFSYLVQKYMAPQTKNGVT